jgi:hypothetical protein
MGLRDPRELGIRRPARRRNGVDGFGPWGGMVLNGDPASQPPNRPRHLENFRIVGGNYRPRPGVTPFNIDPLQAADAKITSLVDFQVNQKKLYMSMDGCPGISTTIGSSVNWADTEDSVFLTPGIYYSSSVNLASLAVFDGRVYFGVDSVLKAFTLIQPPYGDSTLNVSGVEQSEVINTFVGYTVSFLEAFDGKLFIGLYSGAPGTSKIAVWDGLTIHDGLLGTTADNTGINKPTWMTRWRDKLVIGNDTQDILIRDPGDVPGTYATVAIAAWHTYQMTSYRDNLYLVGGGNTLKKYDGAAITNHVIANAEIVSLSQPGSVFGNMYYGYRAPPANAPTRGRIGKLDSAGTFTDAWKIFSVDEVSGALYVRTLNEYRGVLAAGVTNSFGLLMMFSPDQATSGTYVQQNGDGGDINMAIVA